MQIHWLWLAVGLIPYSIKRQYTKQEQLLCAHALFWHLTIRWQEGRCSWAIFFPWMKRWRQ